ncbi:MAG: hypothetical protein C4334_12745 [Pyrinomonas sp.]|uniref:hypothetical protein n=1 Tax=Pyrinomonas sp. TaxID=2080306 RepID=UPI00332A31A7
MKRAGILMLLVLVCSFWAQGQQPAPQAGASQKAVSGITPNGVMGEVQSVDATSKRLIVRADGTGESVEVRIDDGTRFLRTRPGATTLEGATPITLGDVSAGDRVWARGRVAEDRKSVPARAVIVMTKADIAEKRERERAEWIRRGVVGTVTAVDPARREITLQARSFGGPQTIVVEAGPAVKFRRYAPDSVKFDDAKPSAFEEIRVGDQLRAKGERSPDGMRFKAEEIVSGSFRTVFGTVVSADPVSREVKIKDLQSQQTLTVVTGKGAMLRRIPAEFAAMLAQRVNGQGGAMRRRPDGQQGPPRDVMAGPPQSGPGGGRMMRGGFDVQEMLERLPALEVSELKPGDLIVVQSTRGADPTRLTAVMVVAGLDALLPALQSRAAAGTLGPGMDLGLPGGILDLGIGLP